MGETLAWSAGLRKMQLFGTLSRRLKIRGLTKLEAILYSLGLREPSKTAASLSLERVLAVKIELQVRNNETRISGQSSLPAARCC